MNKYLSNLPANHNTLFSADMVDLIDLPNIPDELKNFFILDIRKAPDFKAGHIPNAVNIPFLEVARPQNLEKLPMNKPILVVCYTGHTASQLGSMLNLMGFKAYILRFGMVSWRDTTTVTVSSAKQTVNVPGPSFPMEVV